MIKRRNKNRQDRINEAIKEEMALILRDMKDPRLSPMTSVLRADTSRDLNYCKIYYSVMGDQEEKEKTAEALKAGGGYIRRELAARLDLRQTPELTFILDDSVEYSIYLGEQFKKIHEEDEERLAAMTPEMRQAKEAFEQSVKEQEQAEEDDLWFLDDE
ncbi:MAG: 30S ribosome-binding factor RbfA [Firmicutes bacterium]|nr:30S ribosome-binding factor RbfA [Bacillota bacterium]